MAYGASVPARTTLGVLLVAAAVAAAALAGPGGAASTGTRAARAPQWVGLGVARGVDVRDRVVPGGRALAGRRLADSHGGPYTTSTGETVRVFVSDAYPVDDALNLHWAEFLAHLVHGNELAKATVYVAPLDEVQTTCRSTQVEACYFPSLQQLVVPGDVPPDGTPIEEIVAHEYGHHVALNRSNFPWLAANWGTKRWSTYEGVCPLVLAHKAFPGDEGSNYFRNPGEAFAEAYRVLNDRKAPLSSVQLPWSWDLFEPDDTALALLEQDVLTPWTGSTVTRWRGRLAPGRVRRLLLPLPRDGLARFVLQAPRGSAIAVFDAASGKLVGAARTQIRYGVCGERRLGLAVQVGRRGTFSVTIARP
jgi:hypothetical protein